MSLPETPIGWLALFVLLAVCGVLVMLGLSALMDKLDGSKGDSL